jgi:hypothetical protein
VDSSQRDHGELGAAERVEAGSRRGLAGVCRPYGKAVKTRSGAWRCKTPAVPFLVVRTTGVLSVVVMAIIITQDAGGTGLVRSMPAISVSSVPVSLHITVSAVVTHPAGLLVVF